MSKKKNNNLKFILDTNWVFDGILDSEQKQYILLDYFQKLNKSLEEMKIYPMFTEISLHLGNIQTLLTQNQILYTDKELKSYDDEFLFTDLKLRDVPKMNDQEFDEYQKILKYSQPKLFDYFNIVKAFWSLVYDSITVTVRKNKSNVSSKTGYFFFQNDKKLYVWKYTTRKVNKSTLDTKTNINLIVNEETENLTTDEILSKFYNKDKSSKLPVFEIKCNGIFPLEETLVPIFKRRILSFINQQGRKNKVDKKLLQNGIQ